MTSRRLLLFILAFVIGVAWALTTYVPALASTSAGADSLAVPPDSTAAAQPDSIAAAAPDSAAAAQPDSAAAAPPDSAETGTTFKPKGSALPDTLEFLPPPGSHAGGAAKPGDAGPVAPKPRTGFLGIHPIAILFGIAALHYFIIKAVSN